MPHLATGRCILGKSIFLCLYLLCQKCDKRPASFRPLHGSQVMTWLFLLLPEGRCCQCCVVYNNYMYCFLKVTLLRALVVSKLDYSSTVLAGAPAVQLNRLQSVLNAAARLVFLARKYEHTSPLLREVHWLKVPQRIQFRLCVLTYRCLHGSAPSYLAETSFQLCNA